MRREQMTDHDLLIHLDATVSERLSSLDERLRATFDKVLEKITEIATKLDQKADKIEILNLEKELLKQRDSLEALAKEFELMKHKEMVYEAKRQAYLDVASWGWKTWVKIMAMITFGISIFKLF